MILIQYYILFHYYYSCVKDPRTPALLKLRDKTSFVLGVLNVFALAFFIHGIPWFLPWYDGNSTLFNLLCHIILNGCHCISGIMSPRYHFYFQ